MNFDYDKIKQKIEHGGNAWTSYSDLFLVLSVVFLLLYVVANLRSSAASFITANAFKEALKENEELKSQVKAFEVLKDNYLQTDAPEKDAAVYQKLMGHLDMLGEETKQEKELLQKKAEELNAKENAVNHYQMLMKGIINANMVAQAKLKHRDLKIEEKDKTILAQDKNITNLNQNVAAKESEIEQNGSKIASINADLERKISELKSAYRNHRRSKEKLEAEISKVKLASEAEIASLEQSNKKVTNELKFAQSDVEEKNRELEKLISTLNEKEASYKNTIAELQANEESKLAAEHKAFEKKLAATKLGAEEKIRKQQEYLASVEAEKSNYNSKLGKLQNELLDTRENIQSMEAKYQNSIASLSKDNTKLKRNLGDSLAKQNARKLLAQKIRTSLARAGVQADVDEQTGEVTLRFANEYFDYNKAVLKQGMRAQLEKLFPSYTAGLLEDKNLADKVGSVDIVGYASPTFNGHTVDPKSLNQEDRQAVNYNMDLSYRRAKAIFEYVFDTKKMQYKYQKEILNIVHVTGRSYLAEVPDASGRSPASGNSAKEFCSTHDCQKSQQVIIKFNLKED